jgi:hypothetical protein
MAQSLLERVADRFRGRLEKQQKTFGELVQQVADGTDLKPEAVERILVDANKTPDDLAAGVKALQHRRRLRAAVELARQASAERPEAEAAIAKNDTTLKLAIEGAQTRHAAAKAPLDERLRQIARAERDGERAEAELRDSADAPQLRSQIVQVEGQLAEARRRRDGFLHEAHKADREAGEACYQWSMPQSENNPALNAKNYREAARERMERFTALADKHRKDAEPHAAESRRLEAEIAALQARLLDP